MDYRYPLIYITIIKLMATIIELVDYIIMLRNRVQELEMQNNILKESINNAKKK